MTVWHLHFQKGLDLQGGTSITLKANMKGIPTAEQARALRSSRQFWSGRVNLYGVSEPLIQTQTQMGNDRVIVELTRRQ